jgi:hypothetical protein
MDLKGIYCNHFSSSGLVMDDSKTTLLPALLEIQ